MLPSSGWFRKLTGLWLLFQKSSELELYGAEGEHRSSFFWHRGFPLLKLPQKSSRFSQKTGKNLRKLPLKSSKTDKNKDFYGKKLLWKPNFFNNQEFVKESHGECYFWISRVFLHLPFSWLFWFYKMWEGLGCANFIIHPRISGKDFLKLAYGIGQGKFFNFLSANIKYIWYILWTIFRKYVNTF